MGDWFNMDVKVTGIPESILLCDAFVEALRGNPLRRMLRRIARDANQFRQEATHVDTGSLRSSEKAREISRTKWSLYFDDSVINPKNRKRAIDYAAIENDRGGDHDFQFQTEQALPEIIDYHLEEFARDLNLLTTENMRLIMDD